MAKKKTHQQKKPHGHYCRVCGELKANEKFSGRGHAAHICKKCAALPLAERNEELALRRIEGMAFRYLSEAEIKWLRGKMNDQRPTVRDAAREVHGIKFPRFERNLEKKGLTAHVLEFYIHSEVWSEYGDEVPVHARFFMDHTGELRRIDYDAPAGQQETLIQVDKVEARKFLKAVIHQLDALFWDADLSDADPGDYDPYLDILPECRPDGWDDDIDAEADDDIDEDSEAETQVPEPDREPLWSLFLSLNNGKEKEIKFYNLMHDAPQELFWALMEFFEPDDVEDEEAD